MRLVIIILVTALLAGAGYNQYQERQQRLFEAQQRAEATRLQLKNQYDEIVTELAQVRAKTTRSKHDLWYISHLEKMQKHVEQYYTPEDTQTRDNSPFDVKHWNLTLVENVSMVLIMVIGFLMFLWSGFSKDPRYQQQKGFSSERFRQPPWQDAVANNTHWQPMRGGGANFQTHKLVQTCDYQMLLKASGMLRSFFGLFVAVGLNNMLFGLLKFMQGNEFEAVWLQPAAAMDAMVGPGVMFVLMGTVLSYFFNPQSTVFDKGAGQIIHAGGQVPLSQVHALQIIEEMAGGHDSGVFKSYELNLVLKDGERIHLMDHGNYQAFNTDAEALAEFLDVPLWEV